MFNILHEGLKSLHPCWVKSIQRSHCVDCILVFCSFSFLQYVGIKGVISSDALAKCYDWSHIHKPVSLITVSHWCKFGQKKKGNLVFRLIWFDAISSHTHEHTHTTTNTFTHSSPQSVTGMCGWREAWSNKCFALPLCFRQNMFKDQLLSEAHSLIRGEGRCSGSFKVGQKQFAVQSFLVSPPLERPWCVAWTVVCGLYCTSLEMVFCWWSENYTDLRLSTTSVRGS